MRGFVGRISTLAPVVVAAVVVTTSLAAAASSWTIVASPNPGSANTLNGLIAFAPNEVWGIGSSSSSSYAGCHGRTLTSRWNGTAFVEVSAPATPICAAVNGVAGTTTGDIWAVGSTNEGRDTHLRHWDGTAWVTVSGAFIQVPPSGGRRHRSTGLNAAAALSNKNVWAVGGAEYSDFTNNTLVEHWDGNAWTLVSAAAASGSTLRGITALTASDIWAVGDGAGSDPAPLATLVEHWNGSVWSIVPSPNVNRMNRLRGVSAVSAADVWAVGESVKDPFDGVSVSSGLVEHWDGKAWAIVPAPKVGAGNNVFTAVAARSKRDVWAVGYYDDVTGEIPIRQTLVEHWNGSVWKVVKTPNAGAGDNWFSAVVAPAGTTHVFASGASSLGTLVEYRAG